MPEIVLAAWPVLATAGIGLVAWGRFSSRIERVESAIDTKVSKEVLEQINGRLGRIESTLDRLLEKKP